MFEMETAPEKKKKKGPLFIPCARRRGGRRVQGALYRSSDGVEKRRKEELLHRPAILRGEKRE